MTKHDIFIDSHDRDCRKPSYNLSVLPMGKCPTTPDTF